MPSSNFIELTVEYETWLGGMMPLEAEDLNYKHEVLRHPSDPFPFFRGTYYRWAQRFPEVCPELCDTPRVLAIGDLHLENFGTWRDSDARLCWGINDFDEADELPYANDLVRLACSARFARMAESLGAKPKRTAESILKGYRETLQKEGGDPFVLEENHPELRRLAMAAEAEPKKFWKKLTKLLNDPAAEVPPSGLSGLLCNLPESNLQPEFRKRTKVGTGSLGRPRFVALVQWAGGWVAREAKALAPAATAFLREESSGSNLLLAFRNSKRSPDPFYGVIDNWVCRRLAPRCNRIELDQLLAVEDYDVLFAAMGAETANVHLGTEGAAEKILSDLDSRPAGWLNDAARKMADALRNDWESHGETES